MSEPETVTPRPSIPLVVHASAAAMSAVAIVVAVLYGLIAAISDQSLAAASAGPMFGASLLGQGLGVDAGIRFGPRLSLTAGFVPFGLVVLIALVLPRLGFVSAWLRVRSARILPALAGGAVAVVVSLLLASLADTRIGTQFLVLDAEVQFRPLWAFITGAAPWLLAVLFANSAAAAAMLRGLLALQAVFVVGLTGYVMVELLDSEAPLTVILLVSLGLVLPLLAVSANLIAMLLVFPLGGALGIRAPGDSLSIGFVELLRANPSVPILWGLVAVSVAAVVLIGWRDGASPDLRTALRHIRTSLVTATAVILPMLLLGNLYGSLGGELGLLDLFVGRVSGLDFSTSVGSTGQPLRWILILLVAGIILLLTHVVAARRAGLSWASDQSLTATGQNIARTTSTRLRSATEQAKRAAEAARLAGENLTGGAASSEVAPDAAAPDEAASNAGAPDGESTEKPS